MNNSKIRTFTKRFYLDEIFTRGTTDSSNHWVGSTLKAFRVIATNNEDFQLSIVADPDKGGLIEGIPLREVRLHNYSQIANDAVLENKVIQTGVWVEILFSVEDDLVWTGSGGGGGASSGASSNYSSSKKQAMPSVAVELFSANDERLGGSIQHKSGGSIWVGNPSELNDPDFKNICHELKSGESMEWKNSASLFGKSDSVVILSVMEEV